MINVNFTDDERKKLIDETNSLLHEADLLQIDIFVLKGQLSKFGFISKLMSPDDRELYKLMERKLVLKSRRLLTVLEKIDTNKSLLGIKKEVKKKKKKNKAL